MEFMTFSVFAQFSLFKTLPNHKYFASLSICFYIHILVVLYSPCKTCYLALLFNVFHGPASNKLLVFNLVVNLFI